MFYNLFSKVFFILTIQLGITFLGSNWVIKFIRNKYEEKASWVVAEKNKHGQLDLIVDPTIVVPYHTKLAILNLALFLVLLLFSNISLVMRIAIFAAWSFTMGVSIGLMLIYVDENLGSKVLALTMGITGIAASIGMFSGIDFGFMRKGLLLLTMLFLVIQLSRIFKKISGLKAKRLALFGVIIYIGWLLYDFNKIIKASDIGIDNWADALNISINIYLDIINLFLNLLDLLTN